MRLCMGCMKKLEDDVVKCPYCGYEKGTAVEEAYYLIPETNLHNNYLVGKVLGYGGFGITYIGWDLVLNRVVAIKEYFPSDYATRGYGATRVTIYSGDAREQFQHGLDNFIAEARKLASLNRIQGIVSIYDCFLENDTGYIVMEYLNGETVREMLLRRKRLPYEEAKVIVLHVLDGLEEVHREGLVHRDVAPDNIFLTTDGEVKLLDFGAARYAASERSRTLSVILKPGFAPEEQYRSHGNQGPWTDIYGLGATFYRMITGIRPEESIDRMVEDTLQLPSQLGVDIPEKEEAALMKSLAVRHEDRIQSAEEFKRLLTEGTGGKDGAGAASGSGDKGNKGKKLPVGVFAAAGVCIVAVLGVCASGALKRQKQSSVMNPTALLETETVSVTETPAEAESQMETSEMTEPVTESQRIEEAELTTAETIEAATETGVEEPQTEIITETLTEAEPETEMIAEVTTEAEPETERIAELLAEAEPDTEVIIETSAESNAESEAITESPIVIESEPEAIAEISIESEPETVNEALTEAPAESELITEASMEAASETEPVTEVQTEAASETEPITEAQTEAALETEPVTEVQTEATSETESVTEAQTEASPETELITEAPIEAASETEPVTETETAQALEPITPSDYLVENIDDYIIVDTLDNLNVVWNSDEEVEKWISKTENCIWWEETYEDSHVAEEGDSVSVQMEVLNEETGTLTSITTRLELGDVLSYGEDVHRALTGVQTGDTISFETVYNTAYVYSTVEDDGTRTEIYDTVRYEGIEAENGQTLTFEITVLAIGNTHWGYEEGYTDEYAQYYGYADMQEYKEALKSWLRESYEEDSYKEILIAAAMDEAAVTGIPDTLYSTCESEYNNGFRFGIDSNGFLCWCGDNEANWVTGTEETGVLADDIQSALSDETGKRLLISYICEKNHLEISEEEYVQYVENYASEWGSGAYEFEQDMTRSWLVWSLYEEKAAEFLYQSAVITETDNSSQFETEAVTEMAEDTNGESETNLNEAAQAEEEMTPETGVVTDETEPETQLDTENMEEQTAEAEVSAETESAAETEAEVSAETEPAVETETEASPEAELIAEIAVEAETAAPAESEAAAEAETEAWTETVITSYLGTYTVAGTDSVSAYPKAKEADSNLTLRPNTTVVVLKTKEKSGTEWAKIFYYGYKGWVKLSELTELSTENQMPSLETVRYVNCDSSGTLAVHETAASDGTVLAELSYGTEIQIVQYKKAWGLITVEVTAEDGTAANVTGWVDMTQVSVFIPEVYYYVHTQSGSGANLRETADSSSAQVGSLAQGTTVTITECQNGWGKTTVDGVEGWISMTLMTPCAESDGGDIVKAAVTDTGSTSSGSSTYSSGSSGSSSSGSSSSGSSWSSIEWDWG